MTRTIHVLGKPQEINVQRKYKSVWVAVGEYLGRRIQVQERSENEAMAAWVAMANAHRFQKPQSARLAFERPQRVDLSLPSAGEHPAVDDNGDVHEHEHADE